MKKIPLYKHDKEDKDEYVWELIPNLLYLSNDKSMIYVVRIPTQNELDGFGEFSPLEFDLGNESSEVFAIVNIITTKDFFKCANDLLKVKKDV